MESETNGKISNKHSSFIQQFLKYVQDNKSQVFVYHLQDNEHYTMMNESMMMEVDHMRNDYNLFTINGRSFPDTEPIRVKQGEMVRLRLINAGTSAIHPMHLHGHQFKFVAVDGHEVPQMFNLLATP